MHSIHSLEVPQSNRIGFFFAAQSSQNASTEREKRKEDKRKITFSPLVPSELNIRGGADPGTQKGLFSFVHN